jgi:hypothetical protein
MFLAARDITKVPLFVVGRPHVSWDIRLSAQSSFTASNRAYSLFFATTLDEGIRNSIEHMAYVAAHYHGCKSLWDGLLWQYHCVCAFEKVVMETEVIWAPYPVATIGYQRRSENLWRGNRYLPILSANGPSKIGRELVTSVSKAANSSMAGKPL